MVPSARDEAHVRQDGLRRHAAVMDRALGGLPGISVPQVPAGRTHVYYQYCVYGPAARTRELRREGALW